MDIEFCTKTEIKKLQEFKLVSLLNYVYRNSPFYKKLFDENHVDISEIDSLEDMKKIKFTTKEDLRKNNWDFLCVPKKEIVEFVSSSGTTGTPTFIAMTANDFERLVQNEIRGYRTAGFTKEDVCQLLITLDNMFIAGNAFYSAVRRIGCGIYRAGPGNKERQLMLMQQLNPSAVIGIPSFTLTLGLFAKSKGIDFKQTNLKKGMFVGESTINENLELNELGRRIKETLGIEPFSTYGNTEMACSLTECTIHKGLHNRPDLLIIEVVDDEGNSLPIGQVGELVVTTLGTEGMPLIRYKTGDLTYLIDEKCECGRNTKRMGPVLSRKNHLLKVKGTNLYPGHIENALFEITEVQNYIIEAFTEDNFSDGVRVKVGVLDTSSLALLERIKTTIKAHARVTPEIILMNPEEVLKIQLSKNNRKPQKFFDLRAPFEKSGRGKTEMESAE